MAILEIKGLKKSFGDKLVIDDLAMSIPEHSVFGFVGKNGSGKTTTMRMIVGLLKPDEGSIEVCGERVVYGQTPTNKYIGYLPDVPEYYGYMRPMEYLNLCGVITGMPKSLIQERSEELLSLVGLDENDVRKRKISAFSRGMKQRLGIAQALLNGPQLLLCDEPTSALDPSGRKEILDVLSKAREKTTVVFSTHILADVERICDEVAILDEGHIVLSGALDELKTRYMKNEYAVEFGCSEDALHYCQTLKARCKDVMVTAVSDHEINVLLDAGQELWLVQLLVELNIGPVRFEVCEPDLEQVFLEVVK